MTEAEWLACDSTNAMLAYLHSLVSDRKLRLFAAACCRRVQHIYDAIARNAIEVAERMADSKATNSERRIVAVATNRLGSYGPGFTVAVEAFKAAEEGATCAADEHARALQGPYTIPTASGTVVCRYEPELQRLSAIERVANVPLLRDIFGNPFRPVTFSPSWRTSTAVALASQMYESREFGAMPILADALQDAGCDSADVLDHCRGPGPHVRGCWVVDLVLGKE